MTCPVKYAGVLTMVDLLIVIKLTAETHKAILTHVETLEDWLANGIDGTPTAKQ
jgi:hypothetical protein